MFVSAENTQFDNRFSGSMVVEVVVKDPGISDTNEGKGEPNVSINGKSLRMVQATDGNWYAYFANVDRTKAADATVGLEGKGLDFGVFCSKDTSSSVFGVGFSETIGIAVPRSAGLGDFTNGNSPFVSCTGSPTTSSNLNKSITIYKESLAVCRRNRLSDAYNEIKFNLDSAVEKLQEYMHGSSSE